MRYTHISLKRITSYCYRKLGSISITNFYLNATQHLHGSKLEGFNNLSLRLPKMTWQIFDKGKTYGNLWNTNQNSDFWQIPSHNSHFFFLFEFWVYIWQFWLFPLNSGYISQFPLHSEFTSWNCGSRRFHLTILTFFSEFWVYISELWDFFRILSWHIYISYISCFFSAFAI